MADPMWANAVGGAPMYDARELRRDASGLYWKGGTPDNFGARSGILRSQNAPEAAIAGMTVTLAPTNIVFYPDDSDTLSGIYTAALETDQLTVSPADGSLPRIDLVVARLYDDNEDMSGMIEARYEIIAGTPASVPSAPNRPLNAVEIARVSVPAGSTTPSIVNTGPRATSAGGILPVRSVSELPLSNNIEGLYADVADIDELYRWSGTTWTPVASGTLYNTARTMVSVRHARAQAEVTQSTAGTWQSLTGGPSVDVPIGPNGRCLILWSLRFRCPGESINGRAIQTRINMTGANTLVVGDNDGEDRSLIDALRTLNGFTWVSGLAPGNTTMELQYNSSAPGGTIYGERQLFVLPM